MKQRLETKQAECCMKKTSQLPKIEFPYAGYPIKILGAYTPDFKKFVLEVVKTHDPDHNGEAVVKISRNGNFQSITVKILVLSQAQLEALFNDLKASGRIKMVL